MDSMEIIKKNVDLLLAAPHCCQELKDACTAWLNAVGTDGEKAAAKALVAELEEDVMSVDSVIEFFSSDDAKAHFGEEAAANICGHAKEIKANGAKYCDCAACSAGAAILEVKDALLA